MFDLMSFLFGVGAGAVLIVVGVYAVQLVAAMIDENRRYKPPD